MQFHVKFKRTVGYLDADPTSCRINYYTSFSKGKTTVLVGPFVLPRKKVEPYQKELITLSSWYNVIQ